MTNLTQQIGDTTTHRIALRWAKRAFDPTGWFLIFTVKSDKDADTDAQAKIEKTSNLGISVSGSSALVQLIPFDTAGGVIPDTDPEELRQPLTPGSYDFDVQAQNIANPEIVRTVALGKLELGRDVKRGTETSIPIYVVDPGITYDKQFINYK